MLQVIRLNETEYKDGSVKVRIQPSLMTKLGEYKNKNLPTVINELLEQGWQIHTLFKDSAWMSKDFLQ